ncbi:MAG: class I SAM-dependent methyltransferase [Chloroflexi bacterium]|jgi:ubiquinone/menaquinone biosynthesis C-methylase UbiE|nr:class I SAM-dependent methyltransferase [Chloroflexota bacterium]BCY19173.1 hypothetical protein hrd7_30220 [Leptolinea sp. HRD-7]
MPEHENVYRNEADRYHALVSCEDYKKKLPSAIQAIIPRGSSILESGAGTGRVTNILASIAGELTGLDLSVPMLVKAAAVTPIDNRVIHGFSAGDHRFLPISGSRYDWVVSGWSVCYLASWNRDDWKPQVNAALKEFTRVLRAAGKILLIETLGTGELTPNPPEHLIDYLSYLDKLGFQRTWIRTDYRFADETNARELTGFFFGEGMLEKIDFSSNPILPECTGLWLINKADLLKSLPD